MSDHLNDQAPGLDEMIDTAMSLHTGTRPVPPSLREWVLERGLEAIAAAADDDPYVTLEKVRWLAGHLLDNVVVPGAMERRREVQS